MTDLSWTVRTPGMVSRNQMSGCGIEVFDRVGIYDLLDGLRITEANQSVHLVGIRGSEFEPKARSNGNVLSLGESRGYLIPPPEIVFTVATQLKGSDLPFEYVVIMHEPERTITNNLARFYIVTRNGQRYIDWCSPFNSDVWKLENDIVFIFLAPEGRLIVKM